MLIVAAPKYKLRSPVEVTVDPPATTIPVFETVPLDTVKSEPPCVTTVAEAILSNDDERSVAKMAK